ncbi:uncharacterized protein EDB91DRAFT_1167897 [Suillus paluster]|uniref:uncharacterized protein n=1 Tax=Suillus paluster TaxID=48578 RepID=UPI001B874D1B|nr:uncharacterized protein EDB91DRAFT_1167897 [Suillus paluster]KAG1725640.1 hypothetical protein EDB91DRAFT_1167897 [Suillus paluster]
MSTFTAFLNLGFPYASLPCFLCSCRRCFSNHRLLFVATMPYVGRTYICCDVLYNAGSLYASLLTWCCTSVFCVQ